MSKIVSVSMDVLGILLVCFCIFAEYQKDEWNQAREKGEKIENTTYYKISASRAPTFARVTNAFFVKNADANYHPQETQMDLPTAVMMGTMLLLYFKLDW